MGGLRAGSGVYAQLAVLVCVLAAAALDATISARGALGGSGEWAEVEGGGRPWAGWRGCAGVEKGGGVEGRGVARRGLGHRDGW